MSDLDKYRCFVGSLSWSTTDRGLKETFQKYGRLLEAKVVMDKFSGRSRGFGFVSFEDERAMEEAIEAMNGMDLDGRHITVEKSQPAQGGGRDRDRDYDRGRSGDPDRDSDRGGVRGRDRGYGGPKGGGGGDCYQCGRPGHFARECPSSDGARGGKYGGKDDRKGGGSQFRLDRGGDRYGGSGRHKDSESRGGPRGDKYSRDRSCPYERPSGGYR